MTDSLGHLMERNVLEVFGQRDSKRRKFAISELYTEDCTLFEAGEQIVGRDALNEGKNDDTWGWCLDRIGLRVANWQQKRRRVSQ